jgi:hypothetical protein
MPVRPHRVLGQRSRDRPRRPSTPAAHGSGVPGGAAFIKSEEAAPKQIPFAPAQSGHAGDVGISILKEAVMGGFMDKAKDFADQHDEQLDQGVEKAGDAADQRTGGQHGEQIDRGVDIAQERTGEGDTQP